MDELISRQALVDAIYVQSDDDGYYVATAESLEELINGLPTVQKKGKWTKETKHYKDQFQEFNYYTIKCSVCGSAPEKNWHLTNYCPNCGAYMRGEEE